jgi:hypothetical protein
LAVGIGERDKSGIVRVRDLGFNTQDGPVLIGTKRKGEKKRGVRLVGRAVEKKSKMRSPWEELVWGKGLGASWVPPPAEGGK